MPVTEMIRFISSIGIEVEEAVINEETFLPGILIRNGRLLVDMEKLQYPGDLLHEAGHLAVMPASERKNAGGNVGQQQPEQQAAGEEMMAIAWSYAALKHLQLPPETVFHPDGYKGASDWLIEQFAGGTPLSLPLMQWVGLCYDERNAALHNCAPYPHMLKWLRD